MKIPSITAMMPNANANASVADAKKKDDLHRAAKEFESILVKQLLSSSHVLGDQKGGYADMAVDALAKGMSDSGGIGLAKSLEASLLAADRAPKK